MVKRHKSAAFSGLASSEAAAAGTDPPRSWTWLVVGPPNPEGGRFAASAFSSLTALWPQETLVPGPCKGGDQAD